MRNLKISKVKFKKFQINKNKFHKKIIINQNNNKSLKMMNLMKMKLVQRTFNKLRKNQAN